MPFKSLRSLRRPVEALHRVSVLVKLPRLLYPKARPLYFTKGPEARAFFDDGIRAFLGRQHAVNEAVSHGFIGAQVEVALQIFGHFFHALACHFRQGLRKAFVVRNIVRHLAQIKWEIVMSANGNI